MMFSKHGKKFITKGERLKKIKQEKQLMDYLATKEMKDISERLIKNMESLLSKIIAKRST